MKYFTQTAILRQIGHRRLAKLLSAFDEDVKTCKLVLPEPNPKNEDYFADLSNALATQPLPVSLRKALLTIENAASPENDKPLWSAIRHRIPGVSVSEDCPVDRALDLWFLAPDAMAQFAPEVQPLMNANERQSETDDATDQPERPLSPLLRHPDTPTSALAFSLQPFLPRL